MKRTDYKNEHRDKKYDRLELTLPLGWKDKIKEVAEIMDISVNDYVCRLIKADIDQDHKTEELSAILLKWGVMKKYHPMIDSASHTKSQSYFIRLKSNFINDHFNSNEIICKTSKELRHMMQLTHQIRTKEELGEFDSRTYEQLLRWQVPKCYFKDIKNIGPHQINFKNGDQWNFNSVNELRYMWKKHKS